MYFALILEKLSFDSTTGKSKIILTYKLTGMCSFCDFLIHLHLTQWLDIYAIYKLMTMKLNKKVDKFDRQETSRYFIKSNNELMYSNSK